MKWPLPVYNHIHIRNEGLRPFWLSWSQENLAKGFSYTVHIHTHTHKSVSILESRKQKPADWWVKLSRTAKGKWTAHHDVRNAPGVRFSFRSPWTRQEALRCGHPGGFRDQRPSEDFFMGSLLKRGRTKGRTSERRGSAWTQDAPGQALITAYR